MMASAKMTFRPNAPALSHCNASFVCQENDTIYGNGDAVYWTERCTVRRVSNVWTLNGGQASGYEHATDRATSNAAERDTTQRNAASMGIVCELVCGFESAFVVWRRDFTLLHPTMPVSVSVSLEVDCRVPMY